MADYGSENSPKLAIVNGRCGYKDRRVRRDRTRREFHCGFLLDGTGVSLARTDRKDVEFLLTFAPLTLPPDGLPVPGLNPTFGPTLDTLPSAAGCPFDVSPSSLWAFLFVGNGVEHVAGNNNGFWWGATINGAAALVNLGTDQVASIGHATAWTGVGTNQGLTDTTGEGRLGLTFDYHSVSGAPLAVHIDWHPAENNSGTGTAFTEHLSCSD